MNPITDTTTNGSALAALRSHDALMGSLLGSLSALDARIAEFSSAAAAAAPASQHLQGLQAQRQPLLADIALGRATIADLSRLEAETARAEAAQRLAARDADISSAGAQALAPERAALAGEIAAVQSQGDGLRYAAGVELVHAKLAEYRAAALTIATLMGELVGTVQAAEQFADLTATPPRQYLRGGLSTEKFGVPLPGLQNLSPDDWLFADC